MSYSYDKFLRPITTSDKSIKILDDTNDIKYTIDPFVITNIAAINNILRISLRSLKVILLNFSTKNEAKIALTRLQQQIDTLTTKVPILIDKDIQNYIQYQIEQIGIIVGPTGPQGPTGSIGPQGATGSIGPQGATGSADRYAATSSTTFETPIVGEVIDLVTQTDLAYSTAQNVVIYSDLPNLYNSDYETDGSYFIGQIDYYDTQTGDMSLVTTFSSGSGTYSFWYLNLSGMIPDAATSSEPLDLTSLTTDIIPAVDSQYSLGTSASQWKSLHVSGQTIYIGGLPLSTDGESLVVNSINLGTTASPLILSANNDVLLLNGTGSIGATGATGFSGTSGTSGNSGTSGTSGINGTDGSSGTSGSGFSWKGTWNPSGSYISNVDVVSYEGSNYIKIGGDGNSGSSPDVDSVRWELYTSKGDNGTSGTSGVNGSPGPQGITGPTGIGVTSSFYIKGGTSYAYDTTSNIYRTGALLIGSGSLDSNDRFVVSSTSGTISLVVDNYGNIYNYSNISNPNTKFGYQSLSANTFGYQNVAFGYQSLLANTTGGGNTSLGYISLSSNNGNSNTAIGAFSLNSNTSGNYNTAIGYGALANNTTGSGNNALGENVLSNNTTGYSNNVLGSQALFSNTTGFHNIAIGTNAGRYIIGSFTGATNSDSSIFIGSSTRPQSSNQTNQIVVGYGATGNGSNTVTLGNNDITRTYLKGSVVIADGTQGLGKILTSDANGVASWSVGIQGPTGATGPQGIQGIQGATGSSGISPTTGSWNLSTGANTVSFTVTAGQSYVMWVNGNIPNGIVNWNATVTLSNSNVPVIGTQYGWYYLAGNELVLTSIPSQIIGTVGSIITTSPAVSNSNTFTFGITNNSGSSQIVYYGYIKIS